jgi:hypothetical protein
MRVFNWIVIVMSWDSNDLKICFTRVQSVDLLDHSLFYNRLFIYFESPVSLSSKPTINKQTPHLYNPDSIYFIMTNKF